MAERYRILRRAARVLPSVRRRQDVMRASGELRGILRLQRENNNPSVIPNKRFNSNGKFREAPHIMAKRRLGIVLALRSMKYPVEGIQDMVTRLAKISLNGDERGHLNTEEFEKAGIPREQVERFLKEYREYDYIITHTTLPHEKQSRKKPFGE